MGDKARAARRLSAALGAAVSPDEIEVVYDNDPEAHLIRLTDGDCFILEPGNIAVGPPSIDEDEVLHTWYRNGKIWDRDTDEIRPIPPELARKPAGGARPSAPHHRTKGPR